MGVWLRCRDFAYHGWSPKFESQNKSPDLLLLRRGLLTHAGLNPLCSEAGTELQPVPATLSSGIRPLKLLTAEWVTDRFAGLLGIENNGVWRS